MDWTDVIAKDLIYLNLGGGRCCHPRPGYENYIAVDQRLRGGWAVQHNLRQPLPLPDGTVDRILSEDFIEHIPVEAVEALLLECYRLLKPGGFARIGAPDYMNPKNRNSLERGSDPDFPGHITLTNYQLLRSIVERLPFSRFEFYQYWDGDRFIWKAIDYSLGMIQRTPENYYRLYMRGLLPKIHYWLYQLRSRRSTSRNKAGEAPIDIRYGHPLYATEIVVDLYKS
jgi:predicted SAM-dependent methyltransferase